MSEFKIALGAKVKDRITGFTGIVTGRREYLHGCRDYLVKSQELHSGAPIDVESFYEDDLEVLENGSSAPLGFARPGNGTATGR